MRWAHYSGELTDYKTTEPEVFKGAKASAIMMGVEGQTFFRLRISGVKKTAVGGKYGVHLHQGTCDAKDFNLAGPHYNVTWNPQTKLMDLVSNKTEVWLDVDVNAYGNALSTATVPFIPEGQRSIVLHAEPTKQQSTDPLKPVGWAGTRLACLPFNIKSFPSTA